MDQPVEDLSILAGDIVSEALRTFGCARLRVSGTSMTPAIQPGDLLSIQRVDFQEISIGHIVLYRRDARLITHRVVEKSSVPGASRLVTRGDRVVPNDLPVSPNQLLGRVTFVERGGNRFQPVDHPGLPGRLLTRMLRASDRATALYLRLAEFLRARTGQSVRRPV
jgi:signal peptidase I